MRDHVAAGKDLSPNIRLSLLNPKLSGQENEDSHLLGHGHVPITLY